MNTHTNPASTRHHSTTRNSAAPRRPRQGTAGQPATPRSARINGTHMAVRRAAQPLVHVAGHVSLLIFLETVAKIILDKTPLLALLSLH